MRGTAEEGTDPAQAAAQVEGVDAEVIVAAAMMRTPGIEGVAEVPNQNMSPPRDRSTMAMSSASKTLASS